MRRLLLGAFISALLAGPTFAQQETIDVQILEETLDIILEDLGAEGVGENLGTVEAEVQETVIGAPGAIVRGLDKVSGTVSDMQMANGETQNLGRLSVTLGDCRYPAGNPAGDAYAWLVVQDPLAEATVFEGWMIASSPALSALDHARYDVWVIRCVVTE